MFFTVVISVYNAKNFLGTMIQSVLGQTFGDFELLLLDDGSTDGSGWKEHCKSTPIPRQRAALRCICPKGCAHKGCAQGE